MITHPIHPDDLEQLLRIRRYLIGYRKTNGWTRAALSQMISGTDGRVYDLESNTTWQWRFSRLQAWPVPFGMRLDVKLWFPDNPYLDKRVHEHPEVAPMFALSKGTGHWQSWQRNYLTSALRIAREDLCISTAAMGKKMGISAKGIWRWENTSDEVMLGRVLGYARLLDGFVDLKISDEVYESSRQ